MLSALHPVSPGTCLGRELHVLKQEFSTSAQLACGVDHSLLCRAVPAHCRVLKYIRGLYMAPQVAQW